MASGPSDRSRFETIYSKYLPEITKYVRRRAHTIDVADVVADIFVVVWRRIDDVPPDEDALLWIYGVARRVLGDHWRATRRRKRLTARLGSAPLIRENDDAPQQDAAVDLALSRLRDEDREVLMLTYWEGLSREDLATVVGRTVNAATLRLHRAKRRFFSALNEAEVLLGSKENR